MTGHKVLQVHTRIFTNAFDVNVYALQVPLLKKRLYRPVCTAFLIRENEFGSFVIVQNERYRNEYVLEDRWVIKAI